MEIYQSTRKTQITIDKINLNIKMEKTQSRLKKPKQSKKIKGDLDQSYI